VGATPEVGAPPDADAAAAAEAARAAQPLWALLPPSARARYVRYKPGMNCLVAYDLEVAGTQVAAYAKAYHSGARDQLAKAVARPAIRVATSVRPASSSVGVRGS